MSSHGAHPWVMVIGDLCLDHNEVGGRELEPTWGSPALFIARQLERWHGVRAVVSGPYGADLVPYLDGFVLDRGACGERSLAYRNVAGAGGRVQWWRAGCVGARPVEAAAWEGANLLYFCPLLPDTDRAADLAAFRASRGEGRVQVLLAQGLMRVSAGSSRDGWRLVERRDVSDDEAAGWGCFDIVVFSDEDLDDAVGRALGWSAVSRETGFVVTQGGRGATLCYRGEATGFPVEPVGESSPVGAGDVFGAAVGWEFYSAFVLGGGDRVASLGLAVSRGTTAATAYARSAV